MKFRVLVGEEFPCYVAEEHPSSVVINVTQTAASGAAEVKTSARPKRVIWTAVISALLLGGATLPATIYGMATGDYSSLKSIADASRDLLQTGAKLLK
jgi:hypothetical protein